MPELPEVQTTVDYLARTIKGEVISAAWMDKTKGVNTGSNLAWTGIRRNLIGRKIIDVTRRAKFIVIRFDNHASLWIHQKMTGHLLVGKWVKSAVWTSHLAGPLSEDPRNRYIRFMLNFHSGNQMALSDARRFARIIFVDPKGDISRIKELAKLGPEPLELNLWQFKKLILNKNGTIKAKLTDPSFIAGIGNIYADEILHASGIHPLAKISNLDDKAIQKLFRSMVTILKAAIKAKGSSTDDYRIPDGHKGSYQNYHRAYQKTGEVCGICGKGKIRRIISNGRSSHFCPSHQIK